ncbi:MAG: DUF86 domain-containing protein [Deltaproteobacteria bacterium]|nr:DUF86 domain-containing protein [Deltaproteobacteria bacterium]
MVISTLNTKLIEDRLGFINLALAKLKNLRELSRESFFKEDKPAVAESYLRRCLEALFDIARHISARTAGKGLVEYKEIAKSLGEKGIITRDLAEKLVLMAGYRNRMTHLYHEISNEELYKIISENLNDIEEFVKQIKAFLEAFKLRDAK